MATLLLVSNWESKKSRQVSSARFKEFPSRLHSNREVRKNPRYSQAGKKKEKKKKKKKSRTEEIKCIIKVRFCADGEVLSTQWLLDW